MLTYAETTTQLSTTHHHIENIVMVRTSLRARVRSGEGAGRRAQRCADRMRPAILVCLCTRGPRVRGSRGDCCKLHTARTRRCALVSPFSSAPRGTAERIAAQLSVARVWVGGAPALPD